VTSTVLADVLDPEAPVLVLAPDTIPEPRQVRELLSRRATAPQPVTWISGGRPTATYYPEARALSQQVSQTHGPHQRVDLAATVLSDPHAVRLPAPAQAWSDASNPDDARDVERRLVKSLHQPGDGYLARFDRHISIALSRLFIRTPITPNAVTALSLVVGLGGAALLASADWSAALFGVALLWVSCILDGCDGEVARLKMLTSRWGARFDIATDHVVHLATFVAIVTHLQRLHPGWSVESPAVGLLVGVVLSMVSVWWLINRYPAGRRLGFKRTFERIASRDYIYVVIVLTVLERLDWFIWAAAIGANLFWVSLWLGARTQRTR
jgi:phosphatidylglycerophosphate synthase